MLEPRQRGIERALFDEQGAAGNALDAQQDAVSVLFAERQRFEDEEIEGAGQELGLGRAGRWGSVSAHRIAPGDALVEDRRSRVGRDDRPAREVEKCGPGRHRLEQPLGRR